jgi:hypothetical protein
MRKNCREAMLAWTSFKTKKRADSIWTADGVLYSYSTALLVGRYDSIVQKRIFYLNLTKYSVTTTIHQSAIHAALRRAYPDAIFVIFRDLPRGVQDLKSLYPSDEYEYTIEGRVA